MDHFTEMATRFNSERGHVLRTPEDCFVIKYQDTDKQTGVTVFLSPTENGVVIEEARARNGKTLEGARYGRLPTRCYSQSLALAEFHATCVMSSLLIDSSGPVLVQETLFPGEPQLDAAAERARIAEARRVRRNEYQRQYRRRRVAERALMAANGLIFE